jgi:hypothetical protein
MTPMQILLAVVAVLVALWLAGFRVPGMRRQGGCPYAGTASCGCGGGAAAPPLMMPRSSEDLLTRM